VLEKGSGSAARTLPAAVEILERKRCDFRRGTFRVAGDVIEVFPTYDENAYRIEMFGDEIESLAQIDPLFGQYKVCALRFIRRALCVHRRQGRAVTDCEGADDGFRTGGRGRMVGRSGYTRTRFDGDRSSMVLPRIEISRHFSAAPGEAPPTAAGYFPRDFWVFVTRATPRSAGCMDGLGTGRKQNWWIRVQMPRRWTTAR